MILSGAAIRKAIQAGKIAICPCTDEQIDRAHVDLHLGALDRGKASMLLGARCFMIATTTEKVTLADDICGFVEGRASLAKYGISVEQSSSLIEPGSDNHITLEIFNASDTPFRLQAGQPIAKMYLAKVTDEI